MKKIMIIGNSWIGIYKFRIELIIKLLNKGYFIEIVCPNSSNLADKINNKYVKFLDFSFERHGKNIFKEFLTISRLSKIIKNSKPDVVLSFTIKPNIYGGFICYFKHIPYIINVTGLGDELYKKSIFSNVLSCLYGFVLKKSSHTLFQNTENANFFNTRGTVLNNYSILSGSGVNLNQFKEINYPVSDNIIVFTFIGRITKDKGICEFLTAAKIIKSEYTNILFNVVGNIEKIDAYFLNILNDKSIVNYLGYLDDIHFVLEQSHAIVLPSYHEGTSNVLLEALASCRPVIASNIPGCNNTFDNLISGLTIEPKSVDSLINAMKYFINMQYDEKKKMGYNGRLKVVNEFDRELVVKKYIDLIKKI